MRRRGTEEDELSEDCKREADTAAEAEEDEEKKEKGGEREEEDESKE